MSSQVGVREESGAFSHLHLNVNSLIKTDGNKYKHAVRQDISISPFLYKTIIKQNRVDLVDSRLYHMKITSLKKYLKKRFHIVTSSDENISRAGITLLVNRNTTDNILETMQETPTEGDTNRLLICVFKNNKLPGITMLAGMYMPANLNKHEFLNKAFNQINFIKQKYQPSNIIIGTDANIRLDDQHSRLAKTLNEKIQITNVKDTFRTQFTDINKFPGITYPPKPGTQNNSSQIDYILATNNLIKEDTKVELIPHP